MDSKIRKIYRLDALSENRQKAAEIAFDEAVFSQKHHREYGLIQNIHQFIGALGADKLPEDKIRELVEKTRHIVKAKANQEILNEGHGTPAEGVIPKRKFKWSKTQKVPKFGLTS